MKNVRGGIRTEDQSGAEQVQDHGGESWWEQQQPPRPAADLRSHYEARGLSAECVQGQAQPLFISHCRLLRVCVRLCSCDAEKCLMSRSKRTEENWSWK